jgi:hypothetical protein
VKLGLACLSSILFIVEAFNGDTVFSIDLGFTIGLDLISTCLACYLHHDTYSTYNNESEQIHIGICKLTC